MSKARMIGYNKPYINNSRFDERYRRKMEASRLVSAKKNQGGVCRAAKQSKA